MKEFSKKLEVNNKNTFHKYRFERNLAYLRREITENMLLGNEEDYFDLENFRNKFNISKEDLSNMVEIVKKELEKLNWNTKLSFGSTALFIYSSEDPPSNCYPDEI
jgi:transcriptional antiterminator